MYPPNSPRPITHIQPKNHNHKGAASRLASLQGRHQGLNRQGRIPFAAVIHQDIRLSLLSHRFLHQVHGVSPHLWKLFYNLRVRFSSFHRRFIGHLARREEAQDRKGCGKEITDLFRESILWRRASQTGERATTGKGEMSAYDSSLLLNGGEP